MSKPKDEMFSSNIRMPKHLAHKLNILAESDDRSLNSYMIKALQDHVTEFETMIVDTHGTEHFSEIYLSIFGEEYPPYLIFEQVSLDIEQVKTAVNNIRRGKTINNIRQSTDDSMKVFDEFLNDDKTPTE